MRYRTAPDRVDHGQRAALHERAGADEALDAILATDHVADGDGRDVVPERVPHRLWTLRSRLL